MLWANVNCKKKRLRTPSRKKALEKLRKDILSEAKENIKLMRKIDNVKSLGMNVSTINPVSDSSFIY